MAPVGLPRLKPWPVTQPRAVRPGVPAGLARVAGQAGGDGEAKAASLPPQSIWPSHRPRPASRLRWRVLWSAMPGFRRGG